MNRRNRIDNDLREFCFQFARSSKAGASRERVLNRSHDLGMLMPQNVWPPGTDEIDQLVAVDVEQVRPFAPINDQRAATDRPKSPRRTVHSTGDDVLCEFKMLDAFFPFDRHEFSFEVSLYREK